MVTFERFTDRSRRVLVLAQEEARLLGHSFIGTEHLLLGLIHEGDGVAARALVSLGVDIETTRTKVREVVGDGHAESAGSPPFTPKAKKVLELSLREALQLHHDYIGTEHMLLGLIRQGDDTGAVVLVSMGLDLAMVREHVIHVLKFEPDPPYERARSNRPTRTTVSRAGRVSGNVVGERWFGEIVRAGRLPADFANALDDLVALASRSGVDIGGAGSEDIVINSVETDAGPGIEVRVNFRINREGTIGGEASSSA